MGANTIRIKLKDLKFKGSFDQISPISKISTKKSMKNGKKKLKWFSSKNMKKLKEIHPKVVKLRSQSSKVRSLKGSKSKRQFNKKNSKGILYSRKSLTLNTESGGHEIKRSKSSENQSNQLIFEKAK